MNSMSVGRRTKLGNPFHQKNFRQSSKSLATVIFVTLLANDERFDVEFVLLEDS